MKIKMKMKEFRIWDCGFRKPSLRSQRLCGKSRRVSEYPQSPEAVVRMGGGRSEGAKTDSTAEAQRTRRGVDRLRLRLCLRKVGSEWLVTGSGWRVGGDGSGDGFLILDV